MILRSNSYFNIFKLFALGVSALGLASCSNADQSSSVEKPSTSVPAPVANTPPPPPPPPPPAPVAAITLPPTTRSAPAFPTVRIPVVRQIRSHFDLGTIFEWSLIEENRRLAMFTSPKTTLKQDIPREVFLAGKQGNAPLSIYDVHEHIRTAITKDQGSNQPGYSSSTLGFEKGFAILTNVERIHDNGQTYVDDAGDRIKMSSHPVEGLDDYIRLLLTTPKRHARAFAFIVTADTNIVQPDAALPTSDNMARDITRGVVRLPIELDKYPYTAQHTCTLLIYEYDHYADTSGKIIKPVTEAQMTARQHIRKSGILTELQP